MDIIISAAILTSVPLSIFIYILGMLKRPKYWKRYTPFLVLSLFVMAFAYTPYGSPDLVRYFEQLDRCRQMTIQEVFAYYHDGLFVRNILFWVVAKSNLQQLLPGLTSLCVYSISTYITLDIATRLKGDSYILPCTVFQLCMLPFFSIINNVRNISAFAIVILAVYLDLVKRSRTLWVLVLYLIPIFLHPSAIILLFLRLFVLFARKVRLTIILFTFFTPSIITALYLNITFFSRFGAVGRALTNTITLAYVYMTGEKASDWALKVSKSGFQRLNRLVMMTLALLIIMFITLIINDVEEKYRDYLNYVFLIDVIVLACNIFATPAYWRFSAASNIAIGPILIWGLKNRSRLSFYRRIILYFILMFACMGIALQMWHSRDMVNYRVWVPDILLTNIYVVIYEIFKVLLY